MLKRALVLVGAALLMVGCNSNNEGFKPSPNATSTDNMFFHDAALANMAEIQEAQAALNQSQNPAVRQFAQKMVDDHTQAQDQLSQLAQSKGAMLPTQLDSDDMNAINNVQKQSGSAFDFFRKIVHQFALKRVDFFLQFFSKLIRHRESGLITHTFEIINLLRF